MSSLQDDIIEWVGAGHLQPEDAPRAFEIAGLNPRLSDWRRFTDTLLLWTGVVLIASGVIFFFAYNWQSLHRYGKFALAETLFAAAVVAAWWLGTERPAGRTALLGAALFTGALLALFGQTYQSGADAFELFGLWAALISPWVIVARFAPLWLLWMGLLNLAILLFFQARDWGLLGLLFGTSGMLWALFGFNVAGTIAWELGLVRGVAWLNRWGARVLATLAGGFATTIGIISVVDSHEMGAGAILAYLVWILAMYGYYRYRVFDVFMLAGAALSGIVVVTSFLGRHLLRHDDAGAFLLIGLAIVVMSGTAAWWIRRMMQEQAA